MSDKGHPRCPDCHGAGGKMARNVGKPPRWIRCKCVPSGRIDDSTRQQALGRVREIFEHNNGDPVRLSIAVDVVRFFGVTQLQCISYLRSHLSAVCYNGLAVEDNIKALYAKET
jgi:hypothetical protein